MTNWPIQNLFKERASPHMAEAIATDRQTAYQYQCPNCHRTGSLFDYTYTREPYRYRAFAWCPYCQILDEF
jgi:hypothetical protein